MLHQGQRGDAVRELQAFLVSQGAKIDVDGRFGRETRQALEAFQRAQKVGADGKVGRETMAAIARGLPATEPVSYPVNIATIPPQSAPGRLVAKMETGSAAVDPSPSSPVFGPGDVWSRIATEDRAAQLSGGMPAPPFDAGSGTAASPPDRTAPTGGPFGWQQTLGDAYSQFWYGKPASEVAAINLNNDKSSGNSPLASGIESYQPGQYLTPARKSGGTMRTPPPWWWKPLMPAGAVAAAEVTTAAIARRADDQAAMARRQPQPPTANAGATAANLVQSFTSRFDSAFGGPSTDLARRFGDAFGR